jgi:flagellar basal-body rod modification protein FlgD
MTSVNATDNINNAIKPKTDTGSKTDKAQQQLNTNFNDFLTLLTTQLQNQDPTNPMDSSQFTSQLAQMSAVEQQINTNSNLEKVLAAITSSQSGSLVSYIGKQIDAIGSNGVLAGGGAVFAYNLPQAAATTTISISDAKGNVVYNGNGDVKSGRNQVIWDGVNSNSGATMPDGIYTIKVTAKDAAGKDITATTYTTGLVSAVDNSSGTPALSLGPITVPANDVISVRNLSAS